MIDVRNFIDIKNSKFRVSHDNSIHNDGFIEKEKEKKMKGTFELHYNNE